MNMYDVYLSCYNKHDCVGRAFRCLVTKEEATKFITEFLHEVIKEYCKDFYCLNYVGGIGFSDYNLTIALSKDTTVYLSIDNKRSFSELLKIFIFRRIHYG